jgi:peptidoglycan-N-acetylglucosamine deacetylase
MVIHHVPAWIKIWYPGFIWNLARDQSKVYLTFDDGPVPEVTAYALDMLAERGMKATFFMVGENVRRNPGLARRALEEGHQIGNHTQRHPKGTQTSLQAYLKEVEECDRTIEDQLGITPMLFRPPYGRMSKEQAAAIKQTHQIIMWDVLSGDYDPAVKPETCLTKSKKHTQNGSIVVFHDQEKTRDRLPRVLPGYLDFLSQNRYETALL